ncbi:MULTISPECIES: hypothetical protein, partial [unclassified Campylobacter]|uniref:hypothetical protein n=1 Tax=unclassified Campylobacter TaxID=2593542 RepID=UPI003D32912D
MKKILSFIILAFFLSSCIGTSICSYRKNEVQKWLGSSFYEVSFFIDPSNKDSKRIPHKDNGTYGYGASFNEKNYIVKYFSEYNCKEEIPRSNIYKTGALSYSALYEMWYDDPNRKRGVERYDKYKFADKIGYEIRYLYTKDIDNKYKIHKELETKDIPVR